MVRDNVAGLGEESELRRMRAPLLDRLQASLAEARLFPEPGGAVLAVSGGCDSTVLLDLMAALAPELGLSLVVAHADHGILEDSGRIAESVRNDAQSRYGLEVVVRALGLGAAASETRARTARYGFLRQLQAERGARYLVTAHHADDQIETVLLRLLRGSAPAGLAGIAAAGPRGLVRPLLPFRRTELAAYAKERSLPQVHDPSNADPRHMRAWVRGTLLPVIEERLGDAGPMALLSAARHARDEMGAWEHLLDALPGLELRAREGRVEVARGGLTGYHNVLAGRILRAAARRAGVRLSPRASWGLARFAKSAVSGRRLPLGEGIEAEVAFDRLVIARTAQTPPACRVAGAEGEAPFGSFRVRWRAEAAPEDVPRGGWTSWIAGERLEVRPPHPGDRMVPIRGVGHKRVARLLMEARVARRDRSGWPVIVQGEEVVWVPGVCRGDAAVPAPGTRAVRVDVEPG